MKSYDFDNMTAKITQSSQTSTNGDETHTPSQEYINHIYYEVVGRVKKSRIYGLGSQSKVMFPHTVSTSTGNGRSRSSYAAIEELRTENAELKARVVELEKMSAENTELRARMADLEETMRSFMSRMVHMQGIAVGRAVDLTRFDSFEDLLEKFEEMFEIIGELTGAEKKWQVIYTDDEDDMMIVGDYPWHEFCTMAKKIYIYTTEEVKRLLPKIKHPHAEVKSSKLLSDVSIGAEAQSSTMGSA